MMSSAVVMTRPTATRLFSFLLSPAVLVALAIACGGSSQSPTVAIRSPLSEQMALDLLKRSYEVMETVETFRAKLDMDGTIMGEDLSISMDMELGDKEWMHSNTFIDTPEGGLQMEQVLTERHAYVRISSENIGWIRMELEALASSEGLPSEFFTDPGSFGNSIFPSENIPWEVYAVESVGPERHGGVQTEHLKLDLDFQELWAQLDSQQREQMGLMFGAEDLGLGRDEFLQQIQYDGIDLWIDDRGYQRRMAMTLSVGDVMSLKLNMEMFDFGESFAIDEPDDYIELP